MQTKQCSKCKKTKPLDEFNQRTACADGRQYWCKQCLKENRRQQYADKTSWRYQYHIERCEEVRKYNARWRTDNPDYAHRYYTEHHEEILERSRQYHAENREKINERQRQRNKEHPREYCEEEKERDAQRQADNSDYYHQYRIDNADKYRTYEANRRASSIAAEGTFTDEQFAALCEQYNNRCLCCGEVKKLTIDHIVPLSEGGSNDISNIQPLCQSCNSKKRTETIDYRNIKGSQ